MRYLIEPRERRYVKRYGFMSFAKNFSDKYSKSLTYVLVMSRTRFRVNPHSMLPECQGTPCSKQARNLKFK